jgi:hypothetical protein
MGASPCPKSWQKIGPNVRTASCCCSTYIGPPPLKGYYQRTPTPRSMENKYVTEDVPCGLVPMAALGDAAGVATPVIDGLIALSSSILGRDLTRTDGRTLDYLGLAGKSIEEIRQVFETGP